MFLLDTNIISYWMRGDPAIIERLRQHEPGYLFFSTITLAEVLYGIKKSPAKKRMRRHKLEEICRQLELLEFDQYAAAEYAGIRVFLEKNGTPISERDLQIASIAVANKMTIITHNMKEFSRVPQLKVIDWIPD